MALTVTNVRKTVAGTFRIVVADVTFDSSYATGGEALTPATLGLTSVFAVAPSTAVLTDHTAAVAVGYDRANNKLQAFGGDDDTAGPLLEIASTTDLSGYSARLIAFGT